MGRDDGVEGGGGLQVRPWRGCFAERDKGKCPGITASACITRSEPAPLAALPGQCALSSMGPITPSHSGHPSPSPRIQSQLHWAISTTHPPASQPSLDPTFFRRQAVNKAGSSILDKRKIAELVEQVSPGDTIAPEVEEVRQPPPPPSPLRPEALHASGRHCPPRAPSAFTLRDG